MAERVRRMRTKDGLVWDLDRPGGRDLEAILVRDRGGVLVEDTPEPQEDLQEAPETPQEPDEAPASQEADKTAAAPFVRARK